MTMATTLLYGHGAEAGPSAAAFGETQRAQPRRVNRFSRATDSATANAAATPTEIAFEGHFVKLKEIATKPTLWPRGAEAPKDFTVWWAEYVLRELRLMELLPTRVVASAEGGVAVCFVNGDKYADVECLNTGSILGVISNRHHRPLVWEVECSSRGIAQAVIRIREFLDS